MFNLEEVIKISGHTSDNVLGVYQYGSRVYGTFSDKSDYDFIMVVDKLDREGNICGSDQVEQNNISINIYNKDHFNDLLQRHSIQALETFFLDRKFILLNSIRYSFKVNKELLRKSISEKSDNSWVKSKKKFIVEKDYDPYIAKKSLFHSLRILNFGIQIAQNSKISNYQSANHYWEDIIKNPSQDWEDYNQLYKQEYNRLKSEFRSLAPIFEGILIMKKLDVNLKNTDLIHKIIEEIQKIDFIGHYLLTTEVILEEVRSYRNRSPGRYIYLYNRDVVSSRLDCEIVIKDGTVIKDIKGVFTNKDDFKLLWDRCYGRMKDTESFNLYCRECTHCKAKYYDTAMKINQYVCTCFKKEPYRDVPLKNFNISKISKHF